MEFYKKNPEIKGDITVQGKAIGDDTVVCGEEFKIFANPNTFPGKLVKLIKVDPEDINKKQKKEVDVLAKEQAEKPPKHLGVITSDNMSSEKRPDVRAEPTIPDMQGKMKEEDEKKEGKKEFLIRDKYSSQEMLETFPGVTEANVEKVLKYATTLERIVESSNSALRKMGIAPGYFSRLRDKAKELSEQEG